MRLSAFRIQNYKTISDTGRVEVRPNVTCLLGKNESGKSSVMQAIWKASNVAGGKYDTLYDYPKEAYARDRGKDMPVATLELQLDESEQRILLAELGVTALAEIAIDVSYSGKKACRYPLTVSGDAVEELATLIKDITAFFSTGAPGGAHASAPAITARASELAAALGNPAAGQKVREAAVSLQQHLAPAAQLLGDIGERATVLLGAAGTFRSPAELRAAVDAWLLGHLPTFIYFEDYGRLETRINLTAFNAQKTLQPTNMRVRTQLALFEWTKLSSEELQKLGAPQAPDEAIDVVQRRKEERSTLLESASYALTGDWIEWWDQREHQLHIGADGDDLVLKVSDSENPWRIDFNERSKGFQWFFCFYLTFLVESEKAHNGAILLLDEPGLHLHIRAQQKLLAFFQRISAKNQIIYSSHSPFMVDADHLEEVRTVFLRKGTTSDRLYTSVSHGTEPEGDHDTVLPLQAAVGYELAQTLFLGKQVLIVEGITDYWILKALNQFRVAQGHTGIPGNIEPIFAGGTSHMLPLVSLFLRPDQTDKRLVVLLDGDRAGLDKAAKLKSDMLRRNGAVALMSDADLLGIPGAQVEDVIDRTELLAALSLVRPGAKTAPGSFASNVDFLKAVYVMNGWGELSHAEKARIVLALVDSWRSGSAIPGAKTLANTGKLIDGLVARFGT